MWGISLFLGGQPRLRPRWGPQRPPPPPNFGDFLHARACTVSETTTKFLRGDQTTREENFYTVDHEC